MIKWFRRFQKSRPQGIGKTLIDNYIIKAKPDDKIALEGAKAEIRKFKDLLKEYPEKYHGNTTKWDIITVIDYLLDHLEYQQRLAEIRKTLMEQYSRDAEKANQNKVHVNAEILNILKNLRYDYQQSKLNGKTKENEDIRISEGMLNWIISTLEGLYQERKQKEQVIDICFKVASKIAMKESEDGRSVADIIREELEKQQIYIW